MVVHVFWVNYWAIGVISGTALFAAIAFLVCCLCWGEKHSENSIIFLFNRHGRKSNSSISHFDGLSFKRSDKNYLNIGDSILKSGMADLSDHDENSFTPSQLKIEDLGDDDMQSCVSRNSSTSTIQKFRSEENFCDCNPNYGLNATYVVQAYRKCDNDSGIGHLV